jgi:hypothetical protein
MTAPTPVFTFSADAGKGATGTSPPHQPGFTAADIDRCEQAIRDRVAELNPFAVNVYREGAIAVLEELAARPVLQPDSPS